MVRVHNVETNSTSEFMEEVVLNPDYEFVDCTFENVELTLGYFKGFTFTNCKVTSQEASLFALRRETACSRTAISVERYSNLAVLLQSVAFPSKQDL